MKNRVIKTLALAIAAFGALIGTSGSVFAADPSVTCVFDESGKRICDIDMAGYSYGTFVLTAEGDGVGGDPAVVTRKFYYYPAYAELVKIDGKYYIDVHYNWDDGTDEHTGDVSNVTVKVYFPNSDEEVPFSPIEVPMNASGVSRVELPFEEYELDDGNYRIEVSAYNRDGMMMTEKPFIFYVNFGVDIVVPGTADTGGLFQGTNISRTDFLVTGLIIFGIIAVAGVAFILQHDRKATRGASRKQASRKTIKRRK